MVQSRAGKWCIPSGESHRVAGEIPGAQCPLALHVAGASVGVRAQSCVPGPCGGEPQPWDLPHVGSLGTQVKVLSELCFGLGLRHVFMAGNFRS